MIALDARFLVRYLVQDDKTRSAKARALVGRALLRPLRTCYLVESDSMP